MIRIIKATENPLSFMGEVASACWGSTSSKQIGIDCIESGHGRVMEYPDITIKISEYSARVVREIYTHIIGTTRLQESTRYIEYGDFEYFTPDSIKNNEEAKFEYDSLMHSISINYKTLQELGVPKQDIANILPLGMTSTIVLKINLRAILHMAELRTCNRAYHEFRDFMNELELELHDLDEEWKYIMENYYKTKCDIIGYCTEKNSCGRMPKREDVINGN